MKKTYDAWVAALWDLKQTREQVRTARRDAVMLLEQGDIPAPRRERYAREIVRLDRYLLELDREIAEAEAEQPAALQA